VGLKESDEIETAVKRLTDAAAEFNAAMGEAYKLSLRVEIEAGEDEWLYLEHSDRLTPAKRLLASHPTVRITAVEVICTREHV